MRPYLLLLITVFALLSCSRKIFVVRHAEKAVSNGGSMMSRDPELSEAGKARAESLKAFLKTKKIGSIYSTNTIRTKATAEPTRAFFGLDINIYSPIPNEELIASLRSSRKNILIVGHSNTVDDVVNKICGENKIPGDLDESQYDNLYIIRKKGKKMFFENQKYGVRTP